MTLFSANLSLKKSKLVLFLLPLCLVFLSSCTGSKYPRLSSDDYQVYEQALDRAIDFSKTNIKEGIKTLESFPLLPRLLENRRNYVLGDLYEQESNTAMAFVNFYKVERNYLPTYTLWRNALLAKKMGFEKIVLENLNYLVKKFPKRAKFRYELAKSYARQSMRERATKLFKSVQKDFPETDYAIGSNYYLGNLTGDKQARFDYFLKYVDSSPEGRFAALISNQLLDSSLNNGQDLSAYKEKFALSYYNAEIYSKAIKHFSKDTQNWIQKASTMIKLRRRGEAATLLMAKIAAEENADKAKEAIELLNAISPRWLELERLRQLLPKVKVSKDKVLWHIALITKAKNDFAKVYKNHPDSFYAPESMSRVFWKEYKRKNYQAALELAQKHWENYEHARSHPMVAFWAAKILLKQEHFEAGREALRNIIETHPKSYYRFRAESLLGSDKDWFKLIHPYKFVKQPEWDWPQPWSDAEIKKKFGADILELIRIHQFETILNLEESEKLELATEFKMWLFAKARNNLKAISTAYFKLDPHANPDLNNLKYEYSFPLLYCAYVADETNLRERVDPLLVHALIKQESRYQPEIVSKVGAIGLMQLMPYTAKAVARDIRFSVPRIKDLYDPETNIKLGVAYLDQVLTTFNNNLIYAIASYNAGPVAVKRWMRQDGNKDPDLFVEEIPYRETKGYVKKVLSNYWLYKDLYS